MIRNANNPDMAPGAYMKVIDNGERAVPRSIQVHDGWNGGIEFFYPSAIQILTVAPEATYFNLPTGLEH